MYTSLLCASLRLLAVRNLGQSKFIRKRYDNKSVCVGKRLKCQRAISSKLKTSFKMNKGECILFIRDRMLLSGVFYKWSFPVLLIRISFLPYLHQIVIKIGYNLFTMFPGICMHRVFATSLHCQ